MVNALSDWLELTIYRDGKKHRARFETGETVKHLEVIGDAEGKRGTEVRFMAVHGYIFEPGIQFQDA